MCSSDLTNHRLCDCNHYFFTFKFCYSTFKNQISRGGRIHHFCDSQFTAIHMLTLMIQFNSINVYGCSEETQFLIPNYISIEANNSSMILTELWQTGADSTHEIHTHFLTSFLRFIWKVLQIHPFAHLPKLLPTYLAISVSKQTDNWCCWHFKQLHWFSMRSIFYLCHCLPLTSEETTYISFCIPHDSDPNLVTFYAIFAMKRNKCPASSELIHDSLPCFQDS